jgi:hypothetical protein
VGFPRLFRGPLGLSPIVMPVPVLWTTSLEASLVDGVVYGENSRVVHLRQ